MIRFLCILALLSALLPLTAAERGFVPIRRAEGAYVALVIGNGSYPDAPLANPVNDASDVSAALTSIGFRVTSLLDADKEQMATGIAQFGEQLSRAKAAVFFYAGHGVQVGGENWLLPIGRTASTQITEEGQVPHRAISAGEVLAKMEQAKVPMNLVILDACRNNPFKGAGRGKVQGLAELNAPVGSLVMYSTSAGKVAADGSGRNSPFTTAFLKHLLAPGLDVRLMVTDINATVGDLTGGVQVPWTSMSLRQGFTFVPVISPDEEREQKLAQLQGLTGQAEAIAKMEAVAVEKRRVEQASLAVKQAEVDRLNAQIEDMRKKVQSGGGTTEAAGDGGGLKAMLGVVRQKEAQQKELAAMQQKAEEARQAREAEIATMKAAEAKAGRDRESKRLVELDADLKDYREIASSDFGKDMAQSAWDEVLKKWGVAAGAIKINDVAGLQRQVSPGIVDERAAVAAAQKAAAEKAEHDAALPLVNLLSPIGISDATSTTPRREFMPGARVQIIFLAKGIRLDPNSVTVLWQSDASKPWVELVTHQPVDKPCRFKIPTDAPTTKSARVKVTVANLAGNIGEAVAAETFSIQEQ